jgi:ppGpp synthetase/RelA/SpoT-type nucleotidyltranferase
MSLAIHTIAEKWEKDEPKYKELGEHVAAFIKHEISILEIFPEITFRTKELLSIIKKIKKKQREKLYDYDSLKDKLGVRIICMFSEDMDKIDHFIQDHFTIVNAEYKKQKLDFNTLDYISNHYDAKIKPANKAFKSLKKHKDLVFEIQVRTLNQHAWSNAAHTLSYKQEAGIPDTLKRKVYRLLSLYEIADDEFSSVNNALLSDPNNKIYTLLRKLEGKIYRFARVDFDRELSFIQLEIILSFFSDAQQSELIKGIDKFVKKNEQKIQQIFYDNRSRYFEIPFLTQPEIFLVWYGLEKFFFNIDDNWENEFDRFELEQIQTLWGNTID